MVLAAPVRQNALVLRELAPVLDADALVTDVGSTKRAIVDAAGELPSRLSFIGGHPLAGAARGGLALARGDLFEGRRWVLTPDAGRRAPRSPRAPAGVRARARRRAAGHERRAARPAAGVSQSSPATDRERAHRHRRPRGRRPHRPCRPRPRRHHPARVEPVAIWEDICATNADAIGPALDALIATLQSLRGAAATTRTRSRALFASAQAWRERLG